MMISYGYIVHMLLFGKYLTNFDPQKKIYDTIQFKLLERKQGSV